MSIGVSDGINMKKSNIRGICTRNCNSGVWPEIKKDFGLKGYVVGVIRLEPYGK